MSLWLPEDDILFRSPEVLEQALDRYRRILNGSSYAFWEWGLQDNSYSCGGGFWSKLGYETVDEAVTCIENVQEYIHPDDYKMVNEVVLNHLRSDTPLNVVYRIKAKDGSYWWTQTCGHSIRDDVGRVTYLSAVNFDLSYIKDTEQTLRLSEARYERILSASNDGIWEWSIDDDNETGFSYTSYSCWQHLGYTEDEVDALPESERLIIWRSYIHPDDLLKMHKALTRHFTLKEPFDVEYRMFGQGGQLFWMRARGQAVFNGDGRAVLMSGINIDMTELKAAEERVRKAKDDAEKANNAKSIFLSSMSHELRTPLNAIMGFSQLAIKDTGLSSPQRESAKQIYSAGEHLLGLINDVLDLAQVESGKITLDLEPVLLKRIIKDCFTLVSPLAEQREINLVFSESEMDSIYVYADSMRLKQSLLNVINNAVKYNVYGGRVLVSLKQEENYLCIVIEDTGGGISPEKQKQLFQPFNRLGAEYSAIEGSGIGLVVTKQLVEKMQGKLSYHDAIFNCDKEKTGSGFTIQLPIMASENSSALVEDIADNNLVDGLSADESVRLAVLQRHQSLIYIEDNLPNIYLMRAFLSEYSQLSLRCCVDPLVGLHAIRSQLPDLIMLDVNLPYVSGIDLVKLIKSDNTIRHIPVIAVSANAMPFDIQKAKEAGFDDYLTKPVDINSLIHRLNQFLAPADEALEVS
jgi:PAS domain S-box-containing protein